MHASRLILFAYLISSLYTNKVNAQWVKMDSPPCDFIFCFGVNNTNLFAGVFGGFFISTNDGISWTSNALTDTSVYALAISDGNIFAGTGHGVLFSTNDGTSWTVTSLADTFIAATNINAFAVSPNKTGGINLFAAGDSGVFLSSNNGASWSTVTSGLTNKNVKDLALIDTNLFAGTTAGIFLSTDNGSSWDSTTLSSFFINNLEVISDITIGTNLIAGTFYGGAFLSTDNGTSWTSINNGLTGSDVYTFAVSDTNLFAGTDRGVFLSTNNGASWSNVGFANDFVHTLSVLGTNLFAWNNGIWRRPLSEMITSVRVSSPNVPAEFTLEQNYPNPFNPETRIGFRIPGAGYVSLKVFDVLGRNVANLVNSSMSPGNYEATFNGSNLASGTYFYRLQSGKFFQTRKLVLQK